LRGKKRRKLILSPFLGEGEDRRGRKREDMGSKNKENIKE